MADLKRRLEEIREGSQAGDLLGDYLIQRVLEDPEFRGFDQVTGNYNSFWLVDRELDNRTSLVIDPPNRPHSVADGAGDGTDAGGRGLWR